MFLPEDNLRIWLCTSPTDMRCSFDGLAARARNQLQEDPLSGALFVFPNRRRTQLKILFFDRNGYCVWAKRLERGLFDVTFNAEVKTPLSLMALRMMIDGLVPRAFSQRVRYKRGNQCIGENAIRE